MIILLAQKKLQPAWVLLGSFILIALFLAGLIETAIQLFGNVSLVSPFSPSLSTLAPFLPSLETDKDNPGQCIQLL